MKTQLSDIVCDICNQSCIKFNNDPLCSEVATLEASWGYWSKRDGEKFNLDMCEACFEKVLSFIEKIKNS